MSHLATKKDTQLEGGKVSSEAYDRIINFQNLFDLFGVTPETEANDVRKAWLLALKPFHGNSKHAVQSNSEDKDMAGCKCPISE